MEKNKKEKLLKNSAFTVLGIGGIFATYFLARALQGTMGMGIETVPETDEVAIIAEIVDESSLESSASTSAPAPASAPVAAMTEEEIFSVFAGARNEPAPEENNGEADVVSQLYDTPIDFSALWAVNEHVYAWISVPGTIIDYPVLQHPTDDTRYLNYNIDGSYGLPGCIYTEKMNATDFSDPHTVIYGHNMRNGTMFAKLHEFRKSDFFEANRDVIIYLPDREIRYRIFAAYVYDDRHLMYSFDFKNPDVYSAYLKAIFDIRDISANIDKEMEITKEDKIITLVTCISGQDDKRLLVQAVLID
ncbi:MAG: class B sortase [Lachnospiraceae bacterium]|nr:class B sortase [Lachnospiraceae bacterium]